ncbi:hypothetical protein M408DRAFT_24692 [Serendipita vermifera MAFF 305830]|uniref:F-box domain-containing protein n=1 Tax=Serendipita vermifera MAFF 305830 TaxID=933852 RepID=A0A0C3B6Y6_SERVB|nr:hypothetical protein M408DRAFT_24692 [Serendipita vermifera MAFF 305830]
MPIISLPLEVLSMVFVHYVKDDLSLGNSPCLLMLVCRQWYRIALLTPSLWNTILITKKHSDYWVLERSFKMGSDRNCAMQICTTMDRLITMVSRSGTTPLNTIITHYHNVGRASKLYSLLFGPEVAPRIVHLTLDYRDSWDASISASWYVKLDALRLTNLVSLHVFATFWMEKRRDRDGKSFLQVILEGTKNLREIFIGFHYIPDTIIWPLSVISEDRWMPSCLAEESWEHASYGPTMRRLQRLQVLFGVMAEFMYGTDVPVSEFTIQPATFIEQAEDARMWDFFTAPWPELLTPIMTFSRIKTLHLILDDISLLTKLVLPVLEDLRLTQSSTYRWELPFRHDLPEAEFPDMIIEFPKLRTLRVAHSFFGPLKLIHAVQLESIHLTLSSRSIHKALEDFLVLFPPRIENAGLYNASAFPSPPNYPGLCSFYLNADMAEGGIVEALKSLPSLETLSLVPGRQLHLSLIASLTIQVKEEDDQNPPSDILCPLLRVFELDLYAFLQWDEESEEATRVGTRTSDEFLAMLRRMVSSRELGYTSRLERCAVIERDRTRREYI